MTNDIPRQNGAAEELPRGITYWNDEKRKLRWCWERRIEGKRVRTFFSSLEAAKRGKELAEAAMRTGADGRKVFDGAAQREYEAAKRIAGDVSLIEVAIFYRNHEHLRVKKTEKLSKIADISLEELERRGVSASFLSTTEVFYRAFLRDFGEKTADSVGSAELSAWISSKNWAYYSQMTAKRSLDCLFSCAKRLGFVAEVPKIEKSVLARKESKPVLVISVDETRELLRAVASKYPELLPNVALRCFVGLRSAEAARMRWEWIDFERKRIIVPAQICKTRDDWVLRSPELPETVFSWLALIPEGKRKGAISSPASKHGIPPLGLSWKWRKNALRHTFCTMHISLCGSAEKTALLLRHRGPAMLYRHYLAKLVDVSEANAYFSLTPQNTLCRP